VKFSIRPIFVNTATFAVVGGLMVFTLSIFHAHAQTSVSPPSESSWKEIRLKPVEGMGGIGKVFRLYYDKPTRALFMAVLEEDGLRSIWERFEDGTTKRVFLANRLPGDLFIFGMRNGDLFAEQTNPARIYRSTDHGETWNLVLRDEGVFWQIASRDDKNLYGTLWEYNTANLYRSNDGGGSWEVWKDFQKLFPDYATRYSPTDDRFKLRHLHAVLIHGKTIYVGTGDQARFTFASSDQGEHWDKLWDEGFTAGVESADGQKILFGPDKLKAHGIAVYDLKKKTVTETWHPFPFGYAGYTYSMIRVGDVYYAAMHTEANEVTTYQPKYGLLASPNGTTWYALAEYGPISNTLGSTLYLAEGKGVIFISIDGNLFTFDPLKKDWFASHTPFSEPSS